MSGGKSRLSVVLVAVLVGFVCAAGAEGAGSSVEKLVNLVPDDVVGFVATSGGDELKPAFDKTILGRMWNDPAVQSFCQEVKKEFLRKVGEEEGDDKAEPIDIGVELASLFLKRPIIIGAARKKAKEGPPVYGFAIVDAGPRKAEIVSAVAKLEKLAFEGLDEDDRIEIKIGDIKMRGLKDAGEVPSYWGWVGNRFVFAINDEEGLVVQYLTDKLNKMLPLYLLGVQGTGDALVLYMDAEKVFDTIGTMARMEGEEDDFKLVRTVMSELGLRNVRTMVARVGFSGPDVVSNELVRLQGPRTGLLACLGTIDLSTFDMVDATVLSAGVLNCDVGGVYDTAMRAIRIASPEDAYPEIQEGIAEFEKETGIKIRRDLLASLAGPMAFYSLPAGVMMDAPSGGIVAIAKLKDAGLWEKTMTSLAKVVTAETVVQVSTQVQEGRTFHCWVIAPLAMMQIMPTWTIADNHVVIGSNMGLCNRAVKQIMSAKSGGESLRRTEGFRKATARVPKNLMSFTYSNSQLQFNQMLMSMQQFWPMITMIAQQGDIRLPFMLPQLGHIAKDMGHSSQYCWFDSEGLRSYYRGPGVEPSVAVVAGSAVGAAVLVPTMHRSRDQAQQALSLANLHQLALVLKMYSDDHEGKMPKRLEETVPVYCSADSKLFESPRKPKGFDGPSYIYIQHETENIRGAHYYIVVYENPEFCDDEIPALFLDYSVRAMKQEEFLRAMEKTYKFLGKEMPEIRFKGGRAAVGSVELPPGVISSSNLAGIGRACMIYVNEDEEGRFPPNLEKLVELDYISGKQLESPLKPRGFDGPSYMYVAGQNLAMNPGNVVAYDNPAFCSDEINALFVDGHVEGMKPAEFMQKLEETYKRLGREMPEIRFKGGKPAVSSAHNLHVLGLAMNMWATDHKGMLPKTLEETKAYCPDLKLPESPRKPKGFAGPSYMYIRHETPYIRKAAYHILAYENPEFCEDKIAVLFRDFSVRAMSQEEFLEAMEKTYKFLGKEMPEIRFKGGKKSGAVRVLR